MGTPKTLSVKKEAGHLYEELLRQLKRQPTLRVEMILAEMLMADRAVETAEKLTQIDQLKSWLDGFRPLSVGILSELKQRYDVRFTYDSNAIEGNTLSLSETELILSKGITVGGKTLTEHLEVVGHKEAIDYIETLSRSKAVISEWEIRQIHSLIMRKMSPVEAGRYRQLDVKAAGTGHVYPPHYQLPVLMSEFAEWLSVAQSTVHPIVFASEAHYQFVSIHPFADGNGRTGRLLMNLLLLRVGFPIVIIPSQQRLAYIESLVQVQQSEGDLTALLDLVCQATYEALIETLSVVASAADSKGKGLAFYQDMLTFLDAQKPQTEIT